MASRMFEWLKTHPGQFLTRTIPASVFHPNASLQALNAASKTKFLTRIVEGNTFWVALLVLLNLVLFADALLTNKTFFFRDVSFFHYPLKKLVTEAFSRSEWPLWNPYIQLGQPLLANPNCMALYPTQLLFQILPFELAFELHFVLHCVIAGVATYFLARSLLFPPFAAFTSAAVYNFSGVTLSFVNLFNILPVVAFLPLLTLVFIRLLQGLTLWRVAAASFLCGTFFLLLEPLSSLAIALFLTIFLGAYWRWSGQASVSLAQAGGSFLIVAASGVLLASVQLLPTLELIRHSGRREGLAASVILGWSMPLINLIEAVAPQVFGDFFKLTASSSWASSFFENREPYLLSCYFGAFSLLLIPFGVLFSKRKWMTTALVVVAGIGVLLALGKHSPCYPWLVENCWLFRFGRYPVKFLLIVNFSLALLSGYGLQRFGELRSSGTLVQSLKASRMLPWGGALLAVTVGLFFVAPFLAAASEGGKSVFLSFDLQGQRLQVDWQLVNRALRHLQVQVGCFLVFLLLGVSKQLRQPIVLSSAGAFLLFDLLTSNFWINPLIGNELYEPAPAAVYLQEKMSQDDRFRIYSWSDEEASANAPMLGSSDSIAWSYFYRKLCLTQFLAAKDHIYYSVFNPVDRLETLPSQLINAELFKVRGKDERLRFLAGLNVGYVLSTSEIVSPLVQLEKSFEINSPQPLRLYRLLDRLPRVFLTETAPASPDGLVFQEMLSVGGPTVKTPATARKPGEIPVRDEVNYARIVSYTENQVEVETQSTTRQTLILLDSFYPGWRAFVDGAEAPVIGANYVYRGIDLAPGHHRVVFAYQPRLFRYGLWISGLAAACWCGLGLMAGLRRRRRKMPATTHA